MLEIICSYTENKNEITDFKSTDHADHIHHQSMNCIHTFCKSRTILTMDYLISSVFSKTLTLSVNNSLTEQQLYQQEIYISVRLKKQCYEIICQKLYEYWWWWIIMFGVFGELLDTTFLIEADRSVIFIRSIGLTSKMKTNSSANLL